MTDTLFTSSDQNNKYDAWDLEALKKKALEADDHISQIEVENKILKDSNRELSQTTNTMDEIIARLDLMNVQPPTNSLPSNFVNQTSEQRVSGDIVTKNDVATLVATLLETKQKETTAKANVDKIKKELQTAWGEDYSKKLANRAKELGTSENFLSSMAENYPDAFIKLVLDTKSTANPNAHVPPTTNVRSVATNTVTPLTTWKQFSKAMKDNPNLRNDASFQRKLHETAEVSGPSFWN